MDESTAVLALVRRARAEWYLVAQLLEITGSAQRALTGEWTGFEPKELTDAVEPGVVPDSEVAELEEMVAKLREEGVSLVTVLDAAYPENLRLIYNRPPFLFIRGRLEPDDNRSIAVVGTRNASPAGLDAGRALADGLARSRVTVMSGLALGVDGAAHEAALDAGGRTVAVVGTGIRRMYPRQHADLAERIVASGGALVSQFWPDAPPTRWSFPMRNITMSGMAVGTAVIEASDTSGARNQARRALEHGKKLFLFDPLVMREAWAQRYAERPGSTVVSSVKEILGAVEAERKAVHQMTLA
jgi:DNA processing protein